MNGNTTIEQHVAALRQLGFTCKNCRRYEKQRYGSEEGWGFCQSKRGNYLITSVKESHFCSEFEPQ